MNRDLQGLWIARLARDPLLVSRLLLPVWCVGVLTRFLMTRCTIPTFVNVFAGNLFIHLNYTNTSCTIKVNNNLSLPIPFERGVKQGCLLLLTLFTIFINDLIDCLNNEAKGMTFGLCQVNALLYADDLVLITDKPETLNNLLQALNRWCTENNMDINPVKTKIIHFRHPKMHLCNFTFTCRTTNIDYTDNNIY